MRIVVIQRQPPRFMYDLGRSAPMQRPSVRFLKGQFTLFAAGARQCEAHLRFVGQTKKLDEWIPAKQMRVSDRKRLIEIAVHVLAQDRRASGQIRKHDKQLLPSRLGGGEPVLK